LVSTSACPGLRAGDWPTPSVERDLAGDRLAELELGVADGVTADDRDAGRAAQAAPRRRWIAYQHVERQLARRRRTPG
jgi:hypothetical protein